MLREDHGIVGDAHAGPWHRQVSLLARESIDRVREVLPDLGDGDFAENVVTAGVDLPDLRIGDRLLLGGKSLLEVTQIGKECHEACAIRQAIGDCIMPREGIFCRVIEGGPLRAGDAVEVRPAI
jgi:MOSC domain-containing protein YiiM